MSDSSMPLVGMSISPDGTIDYDFEGHIHADGLDLDELQGVPKFRVPSQIRWLSPEGAEQESIFGRRRLIGGGKERHDLMVSAGEEERILLGQQGSSAFLQLGPTRQNPLEAAGHQINFGTELIEFPGETSFEFVFVKHGLGDGFVTPRAIVATNASLDLGWWGVNADVGHKDPFSFALWTTFVTGFEPPPGTIVRVDWMAIL